MTELDECFEMPFAETLSGFGEAIAEVMEPDEEGDNK